MFKKNKKSCHVVQQDILRRDPSVVAGIWSDLYEKHRNTRYFFSFLFWESMKRKNKLPFILLHFPL